MSPTPKVQGDTLEQAVLQPLLEQMPPSLPSVPYSCQTYDRLLAGERVSWRQLLHEHPLLGSITVPKLIEAGVVQMTPAHDPKTHLPDARLSLRHRNRAPSTRGPRGSRGEEPEGNARHAQPVCHGGVLLTDATHGRGS